MNIETMSFTKSDLEESYDNIKPIFIKQFAKDFNIDLEKADKWCSSHTIILKEKTIFNTISDIFKKQNITQNRYAIHLVKALNK